MAKEKKEKKESKISLTKQELKKVSWPSIKDILKYTSATIVCKGVVYLIWKNYGM